MKYSKIKTLITAALMVIIMPVIMPVIMPIIMIGLPTATLAQSVSVLATVDGTPISNIDLEERRNFLIKTTGIEYNQNNQSQIDNDVLQMLIDDVIRTRAAQAFGNSLQVSAKQRAKELVDASFSQNGEDPDEVLKALGISRQIAEKKFLADVLWASIIQVRFDKQFAKAPEEAQKELQRITKNIQKPHADLDEIMLLPEPSRNYAATRQLGEQIFDALRNGADFGRIAQQYSAAGSGQQGGRLGWVLLERLNPEVREIIETAPADSFTRPIDVDGAVMIYRINATRIDGQADPLQSLVNVYRVVYPVNDINDQTQLTDARQILSNDLQTIASCEQLAALHQQYGSEVNINLGQFKVIDFAPQLRQTIINLNENEISDILIFSEGLVAFMVCERNEPQITLPSLQELEVAIKNRHFAALSARYLSRLRKQAIIAYKE